MNQGFSLPGMQSACQMRRVGGRNRRIRNHTISTFDRAYAGLQGGNNLQTKATTIELRDGTEHTYDPRRQGGVSVFRKEMRSFSMGDRVQFTAPANELKVANRELGTIESVDKGGFECKDFDEAGLPVEVGV